MVPAFAGVFHQQTFYLSKGEGLHPPLSMSFLILSLYPTSYCRLNYIYLYVFKRFEPNTISAYARLA